MDLLRRLRLKRLTRAVYSAKESASRERPERVIRLLPSPLSALVLVLLLLVLAVLGIVRAQMPGNAHAIDSASDSRQEPENGQRALLMDEEYGGAGMKKDADEDGKESPGASGSPSSFPSGGNKGGALLIVHVAGAVKDPGVVHVPAGSRVIDALNAAGGALHEANLDAVNLARPVNDGEQILIPTIGDLGTNALGGTQTFAHPQGVSASSCVDIRTADAAAFETLDGIGPKLAQRIISFRESSGPFESVEDLDAVPGIGPALLARLREGVCQ